MVMGKITKSVVLLVVGALTNLVFENPLIVTVISMVLGFVLFRTKNDQTASTTPPIQQHSNASQADSHVVQQSVRIVRSPVPSPLQDRRVRGTPSYCQNCGMKIQIHNRFCGNCGAELNISPVPATTSISQEQTTIPQWHPPLEVMKRFKTIRQVYQNGQMSEENYLQVIKNTCLIDTWGRYWTIGANSLLWYRNEQDTWVPDQPAGNLSIASRSSRTL